MFKLFKLFFFLSISTAFFTAILHDDRARVPDDNITLSSLELLDDIIHKTKSRNSGNTIIHADADGHFRTNAYINGHKIRMLVDTGASMVAISRKDAEQMGYFYSDQDFARSGKSATGRVNFLEVKMPKMRIGNLTLNNVPTAIVNHSMPPLLGMSFISKLDKMEISNGKLVMRR